MKELMDILKELRPEIDFEKEEKLIDDGILDSFDMVTLIGEINDMFEVDITFDDIDPENFNSVQGMMRLIQRLQQEN